MEEMQERLVALRAHIESKLKKLHARLALHKEDVQSGSQWEKKTHLAEMLKGQFGRLKKGMREIVLEDWEKPEEKVTLVLDPALSPEAQVAAQFKLCRKLKRRFAIAQELVKTVEREITLFTGALAELAEVMDETQLLALEKKVKYRPPALPSLKPKRSPFREFTTTAGMKIYVGKKDSDNDLLTFRFAHGLDLWMHAANTPGSHVVLRIPKGEIADHESVSDALQLALHFSKARERGQDEVVVAECKHVHKPRGAPHGQVTLSRHKKVLVRTDEKRLARLLPPI